jgi:hypothetical protein
MTMTDRLAHLKHGRSAEMRFLADALDRGMEVYDPSGGYASVDCLVTRNGLKYCRIQVKSTTRFKVTPTHFGVSRRRLRREVVDNVDVVAVWVEDHWHFYHAADLELDKSWPIRDKYDAPTNWDVIEQYL